MCEFSCGPASAWIPISLFYCWDPEESILPPKNSRFTILAFSGLWAPVRIYKLLIFLLYWYNLYVYNLPGIKKTPYFSQARANLFSTTLEHGNLSCLVGCIDTVRGVTNIECCHGARAV